MGKNKLIYDKIAVCVENERCVRRILHSTLQCQKMQKKNSLRSGRL